MEPLKEVRLEIKSQIQEMDEKIRSCQKHGYWKGESELLKALNQLKGVLAGCRH